MIDSIIDRAEVCRMALADGDQPYMVTLNFGYENDALYFHCALEGRKIDIIRRNSKACVSFDADTEMVTEEKACGWTMRYKSVVGFGRASLIEGHEAKKEALAVIMRHYSDRAFTFQDAAVRKTMVIKVELERLTGKESK
jgi:hypothetical protein